jgi:hypothetical protein
MCKQSKLRPCSISVDWKLARTRYRIFTQAMAQMPSHIMIQQSRMPLISVARNLVDMLKHTTTDIILAGSIIDANTPGNSLHVFRVGSLLAPLGQAVSFK